MQTTTVEREEKEKQATAFFYIYIDLCLSVAKITQKTYLCEIKVILSNEDVAINQIT